MWVKFGARRILNISSVRFRSIAAQPMPVADECLKINRQELSSFFSWWCFLFFFLFLASLTNFIFVYIASETLRKKRVSVSNENARLEKKPNPFKVVHLLCTNQPARQLSREQASFNGCEIIRFPRIFPCVLRVVSSTGFCQLTLCVERAIRWRNTLAENGRNGLIELRKVQSRNAHNSVKQR